MGSYRIRRLIVAVLLLLVAAVPLSNVSFDAPTLAELVGSVSSEPVAVTGSLAQIEVKGRAPKTGYERSEFGNGWSSDGACDTRNRILARDLTDIGTEDGCKILTGTLTDPYTGKIISFLRGESTSDDVQIDHVVALSNAWQTGAQQLGYNERVMFANDPLNLLAVDGPTNEQKSDGDAATWLPPSKGFRCAYVERQIAVKVKYRLWVTAPEQRAIANVLTDC